MRQRKLNNENERPDSTESEILKRGILENNNSENAPDKIETTDREIARCKLSQSEKSE